MGTINYGTSDYITLSIKPYYTTDLLCDPDFLEYLQEIDAEPGQAEDIATETIQTYYEADKENAQAILDEAGLYYIHIAIKPGYYEGLYIDIENNFPIFFDDYRERKEALAELKTVKATLEALAGCGYVVTCPGWCTSYGDYNSTMTAIKEAVKAIRNEIKNTPTWRQYTKGEPAA